MAVTHTSMRAVVSTDSGGNELQTVPKPVPKPNEILVQVMACALNHVDYKTTMIQKCAGNVLGCDFAGVIVAQGSGVPESSTSRVGDRVAGMVCGNIGPNGAFSEYLVIDHGLVFHLPDDIPFEVGAQLGISCYAACQALYQVFDFPIPFEQVTPTDNCDLLIWSGSTSTGQYAIQLSALSGLRVIATASPGNYDFLKDLGANEVYDYSDSKAQRNIFTSTGGKLQYAIDCFSSGTSPSQVSGALSKTGGKIVTLLPYTSRKKGVTTELVHVYSLSGEAVELPGISLPGDKEHYSQGVLYSQLLSKLLKDGKLRPGPIKLLPGGLAGVEDGIKYMVSGKVHAEKIVFNLSATPDEAGISGL